jgi:hypothetical protein
MLSLREEAELREKLMRPLLERAIGVIYRPESELASHSFEATCRCNLTNISGSIEQAPLGRSIASRSRECPRHIRSGFKSGRAVRWGLPLDDE